MKSISAWNCSAPNAPVPSPFAPTYTASPTMPPSTGMSSVAYPVANASETPPCGPAPLRCAGTSAGLHASPMPASAPGCPSRRWTTRAASPRSAFRPSSSPRMIPSAGASSCSMATETQRRVGRCTTPCKTPCRPRRGATGRTTNATSGNSTSTSTTRVSGSTRIRSPTRCEWCQRCANGSPIKCYSSPTAKCAHCRARGCSTTCAPSSSCKWRTYGRTPSPSYCRPTTCTRVPVRCWSFARPGHATASPSTSAWRTWCRPTVECAAATSTTAGTPGAGRAKACSLRT